jgi:hypothetical protein
MSILKRYFQPTPREWRIAGDTCLIVGTTITQFLVYFKEPEYAMIALALTALGKILTNFAKEEEIAQ